MDSATNSVVAYVLAIIGVAGDVEGVRPLALQDHRRGYPRLACKRGSFRAEFGIAK
jgi:hypothetical protein